MTASNKTLTSSQALNNYFSSLLDEDYIDNEDMSAGPFVQEIPVTKVVATDNDVEQSRLNALEREIKADPLFANEAELDSAWALDPEIQKKAATPVSGAMPVLEVKENKETLQKLLSQVSTLSKTKIETEIEEKAFTEPQTWTEVQDIEENLEPEVELTDKITENIDISVEVEEEVEQPEAEWQNIMTSPWFQVLYFDVQGVRFAVPLTELGGIHRISDSLNKIIGRPPWYLGMQINKENQLDVVDTMAWVMPDRVVAEADWQDYQYVIMLGDSSWGLASVRLEGTERLTPEEVNWRRSAGRRPWLAGMVKDKMCALIHVEALIRMLKAGLDVKDVG